MEMICNRSTGTSHIANNITTLYLLAGSYIKITQMCVDTFISKTMIYYNVFAKASLSRQNCNNCTISGCINLSAQGSGEIHSIVELTDLINRMNSPAIA